MKLYAKKMPLGFKLRVGRYYGRGYKVYGIKILDLLIGISFV
jgi:hypothetical protein